MTTATQHATSANRRTADPWEDSYAEARGRAGNGSGGRGPLPDPERLARGLGWFSIGLGLAQVAAPRRVARMIGVDDDDTSRNTLFAIGVREIASGVGILRRAHPVGPVWTRVGGDVIDLALLSRALRSDRTQRERVAAATAAVLGVTLLDVLTGKQLSREPERTGDRRARGIEVRRAITVDRPQEEVYRFWRNFENLPRFMQHLESVRVLDDRRSHWKARAPAGATVEWDAEILDDRPNELIAWRALDKADVPNTGSVEFVPAPKGGTEVRVHLRYDIPGGRLAATIAKLFGEEPEIQVASDLVRFKQVMELGEVVYSEATVARGRPHPARPPARRINVQTQRQGDAR
jgi:uncharacterized membrane protein